ncbi:hypothetical protein NDU88_004747 [Pleurodeles waltl]|uniref:Uncharacterized protein n=1 Tax=Pleurodeles waltl TaxID=8319 RepID=A0AAV7MUB9_PLEWA|nr:hypothetical protein NDU88_004747 [Pleurodeles waltl]
MDVVEVSASGMCVLLGVVMLVVDVDAVHAGVSVDVTGRKVKEEEEGETVDVVVSSTVGCLHECLRHVPFLQEEETGDAPVAAVDPEDSEDEEAKDEDEDNRKSVICQYLQ